MGVRGTHIRICAAAAAFLLLARWVLRDLSLSATPEQRAIAAEQKRGKTVVAVCACAHSETAWPAAANSSAQNALIRSLEDTIVGTALLTQSIHLYLGMPPGDAFWARHASDLKVPAWLRLHTHALRNKSAHACLDEVMGAAYRDGVDYLVRASDTTRFASRGWAGHGIAALRAHRPANTGVVQARPLATPTRLTAPRVRHGLA